MYKKEEDNMQKLVNLIYFIGGALARFTLLSTCLTITLVLYMVLAKPNLLGLIILVSIKIVFYFIIGIWSFIDTYRSLDRKKRS